MCFKKKVPLFIIVLFTLCILLIITCFVLSYVVKDFTKNYQNYIVIAMMVELIIIIILGLWAKLSNYFVDEEKKEISDYEKNLI